MARGVSSFVLASLKGSGAGGRTLELCCVVGVNDRHVHVLNIETGETVGSLVGHRGVVQSLAVNAASRSLVSLDVQGELKVWDLTSCALVQSITYDDIGERVSALCFNTDDNRLVTSSRRLQLWRNAKATATSDERAARALCPTGHHHPLVGACYAEAFHILITGDAGGTVCVWEVKTGSRIFSFEHTPSRLTAMCVDSSGRRLLTGASDGMVRLWNYSSGQLLYEMSTCSGGEGDGSGGDGGGGGGGGGEVKQEPEPNGMKRPDPGSPANGGGGGGASAQGSPGVLPPKKRRLLEA